MPELSAVAIVMLAVTAPVIFLSIAALDGELRTDSYFKNSKFLAVCEVGSAWFLGLIFVCGGLSKLMPFPGVMGPVWLEEALSEHGLGLFARFIAWAEAIIGLTLLSKHTRVLGSIMMVPMLLNILMVVVSMNWKGTPWVILFFLAHNLFLLSFHFRRWITVIDSSGWLETRIMNPQFLSVAKITATICLCVIAMAPLINWIHWGGSMVIVSLGFLALLTIEVVTKFSNQIGKLN